MKFYVMSGNINVAVAGEHIRVPRDAAREAMLSHFKDGVSIAPVIVVSERGTDVFEHELEEDMYFNTEEILIEAGFEFGDNSDEY